MDEQGPLRGDEYKRDRRAEWQEAQGYREAGGRMCIMRLLGKHCIGWHGEFYSPKSYREHHKDHECWPPHGDHMNLWYDENKEMVFTSQPYGLTWDALVETVDFCKKHGLQVDIDFPDHAWHNPGGVLMLEFRKAAQHE